MWIEQVATFLVYWFYGWKAAAMFAGCMMTVYLMMLAAWYGYHRFGRAAQ